MGTLDSGWEFRCWLSIVFGWIFILCDLGVSSSAQTESSEASFDFPPGKEADFKEAQRALKMISVFFRKGDEVDITHFSRGASSSSDFYLLTRGEELRSLIKVNAKTGSILGVYEERQREGLDKLGRLETRWSATGFWLPGKTRGEPWSRVDLERGDVMADFFKDFPREAENAKKMSHGAFWSSPVFGEVLKSLGPESRIKHQPPIIIERGMEETKPLERDEKNDAVEPTKSKRLR